MASGSSREYLAYTEARSASVVPSFLYPTDSLLAKCASSWISNPGASPSRPLACWRSQTNSGAGAGCARVLARNRPSWRRARDRIHAKRNRVYFQHASVRHVRIVGDYRTGCCDECVEERSGAGFTTGKISSTRKLSTRLAKSRCRMASWANWPLLASPARPVRLCATARAAWRGCFLERRGRCGVCNGLLVAVTTCR